MQSYPRLFLKPGKERPVRARHPWIFSGAVERVETDEPGATVEICASGGAFLARGYHNPRSQIAARVWTLVDEPVDEAFLRRRLERAVAWRAEASLRFNDSAAPTTAFRLVNAEADLLPGLVVDVYGPFVALQVLTAGMERRLPEIVRCLEDLLHPAGIHERSDVDVRAKEGLAARAVTVAGAAPPAGLEVREHELRFAVDLRAGQKTGFYLDQRDNRRRVSELLAAALGAASPRVLNAFAYSGAFGVYVARACPGAQIVNLDTSSSALDLARDNFARNGAAARAEHVVGDAFEVLRRFRDSRETFDAVILDPPKFAQARGQVDSACRGYKDLNLLALKLLRPHGVLCTFSCSGLVPRALFHKVAADAAADAGVDVRISATYGHGPDHPVLLSFPEGEYLKGMALRAV